MKKTILYLIVLIVLFAVGLVLVFRDKAPDEASQKNFTTPEIQSISKIHLKDRQGNEVKLTKNDNRWLLDEQLPVNPIMLNDFLYAIEFMYAEQPAPTVAIDNILTQMISNSTKVSLYKNENSEPFKVFNVGGPTHNQDGTFMLMEVDDMTAKKPYIVKLPGFKGYITYRFSAVKSYWVGVNFSSVLQEEIESVELTYLQEDADESFTLENTVDGYILSNKDAQFSQDQLNSNVVSTYLGYFMDLNYESYLDSIPKQDSVLANLKHTTLTMKLKDGTEKKVSTYYKPFPQIVNTPLDSEGSPLAIDSEKLYLYDHDSSSFFVIQNYAFGRVFLKASQFLN